VDAEGAEQGVAEPRVAGVGQVTGAGQIDVDIERDAATIEQQDAVGQQNGLVDVVRYDQDGRAVGAP
jgi:hypothetical protein